MKTFKITKKQLLNADRKALREIELETNGGWTTNKKIHKSKKSYARKFKLDLEYLD